MMPGVVDHPLEDEDLHFDIDHAPDSPDVSVSITHIPTGLSASAKGTDELVAREEAMDALLEQLENVSG